MADVRPKTNDPVTPERAFAQVLDDSDEESEDETSHNLPVAREQAIQPPNTVQRDSSVLTTGGNRLITFFKDLKKDVPFIDEELFKELEYAFNTFKKGYADEWVEGNTPEGEPFVLHKLQDDFVHYNRVAGVYTKRMHSMFVVSVWAAAYEKRSGIGYVLYPKLIPLRDMLEKVKSGNENAKKQAMRKCFAPIALAIDGLHTPVPNRRLMYYHRDICVDNIYIPSVTHASKRRMVYGQAKLKLTRSTRGSHEYEGIDVKTSVNNSAYPLTAKYYHHPDPWNVNPDKMYQYLKKHDWFSFGVYMLEVMGILLGHPLYHDDLNSIQLSDDKIHYFSKYGKELQEIADNSEFEEGSRTLQHYTEYIATAMSCISVEELGEERRMEYQYKAESCRYYFEYPLCDQTARLLCLFDHSGCKEPSLQEVLITQAKPKEESSSKTPCGPKYVSITCQACLLRPTVAVPTRSYKRGSYKMKDPNIKASKCDKECNTTYCAQCYVNGERLFCPRGYGPRGSSQGHGTTSTVIGHHSSYALIMHGEHFTNAEKLDLFEKDADMLSNVLMHKLICGMPKDNIIRKALYSDNRTARQCLEEARDEMKELIHHRQWNSTTCTYEPSATCVNDSDFCVFVFYSGHGGGECAETEIPLGSWVPRATLTEDRKQLLSADYIEPDDINDLLKPIRKCSDKNDCEGSCVEVVYIMDHCRASEIGDILNASSIASWKKNAGSTNYTEKPHRAVILPYPDDKSWTLADGTNSEITYWFCVLMRSLFFRDCSKQKEDCRTCNEIRRHIDTNCFGAFIDGKCLKLHMDHMNDCTQYKSQVEVDVKVPGSKVDQLILAHYNEGGIHYRVFPYKEGDRIMEMDFAEKTHCESITRQIKSKVGQHVGIRLLTNSSSDSSNFTLVCDHNVRDILDSTSKTLDDQKVYPSILYYQIIKRPVTVVLTALDEEGATDTLQLSLDEYDASTMMNEMAKVQSRMQIPASQLPNILVYIIYHLRHLDEYKPDPSTVQRQSSGGSTPGITNAPQEDNYSTQVETASETDRVRNSLAKYLYEKNLTGDFNLKNLTPIEWLELEEQASRYLSSGRPRVFRVTPLPGQSVSIKWPVFEVNGDTTAMAVTASS